MSVAKGSRLSSTAWLVCVVFVGIASSWWLETRPRDQARQMIIGVYGESLIPVRCPISGLISEVHVELGQEVNPRALLVSLNAPQDAALLAEVTRERGLAEAELQAQLSALDDTLRERAQARRIGRERAQAQAFGVGVNLKSARGRLKTLERSLSALEAEAKAGSLSLAELTRLKSEVAGLKKLIKPLSQQRYAWQRLARDKPDQEVEALMQAWREALTRQGEVWREFERSTRARLSRQESLSAPMRARVASQPLPAGMTCLAGEEIMSLQPLTPVVRLWQISGSQHFKAEEEVSVRLTDERYRGHHNASALFQPGKVTRVGESLTPLPESLQPVARRALMSSALLTLLRGESAPLVRGRPIRALLDQEQPWGDEVPWGAMVQVTP